MNRDKVLDQLKNIDLSMVDLDVETPNLQDDLMKIRSTVLGLFYEINSKPVMPKAFNNWDYEEHECCDCYEMEIENLISMYFKNDLASDNGQMLLKWINQGEFKDNMSRLLRCIDAIRYGCEVEQ